MRATKYDMLNGPIAKGLLSMAIPVMIMNVFQSIFNLIDMTVLGNLVSDSAVGAVGASSVLITLTTGLLIGIASGANVVIARFIGNGNKESAERAEGAAILLGLVGGLALMIIGLFLAKPLLILSNCPETLLEDAVLYFRLYFVSVPPLMIYNFSAAILRSVGETKKPMIYLSIAGIIKVILTFSVIKIFNATVDGVAIATIISNLVAATLTFIAVKKNKKSINFKFKNCRFFKKEIKETIFIGIPTGLQSALYSVANLVIVAVVNSKGEFASTGISIANTFDGILYQIAVATSFAVMPYVSQNFGAKNPKRIKQILIRAILITSVIGGVFGALSAIFSAQLASLMSQNEEVIKYAQEKMIIISSTYFICGIQEIFGATLRGLRKPIVPTISTLTYMCAFRFFWVYLIYPLCPNFTFLYLVWPVGWILSIITNLIFYFPAIKKLEREVKMQNKELKENIE